MIAFIAAIIMRKILIANFVDITSGLPLRDAVAYTPAGNARLVQMKDLHPIDGLGIQGLHTIQADRVAESQWLKPTDVLFVAKGSRFFASAIPQVPARTVASPHLFVLRVKQDVGVLPAYLAWVLNNPSSQTYWTSKAAGTTAQYVRKEVLQQLTVALPSIDAQAYIVKIAQLDQRTDLLNQQLRSLQKRLLDHQLTQLTADL
jgi:hypothetical protein